jgi:hypothetical protein
MIASSVSAVNTTLYKHITFFGIRPTRRHFNAGVDFLEMLAIALSCLNQRLELLRPFLTLQLR